MIRELLDRVAGIGMRMPSPAELGELAVALGLAALAAAIGVLVGRRLGAQIAGLWHRIAGEHINGIQARLCRITRYLTVALLLSPVPGGYAWHPPATLLLGVALGLAMALAVVEVLRGLGLPRLATWPMGAIAFTSLLSKTMGGLGVIEALLARIGFDIGTRRLSLLSLLTFLITVTIIYALVRVANRLLAQWIGRAKGLDPTQQLLGQKLASIAIVTAAFFVGIDLLGIDLTTFAVFSGAFGLAIGFGMQKTVGNLIAGIILLMDRSIKPGDVIVVGDSFGWVNKIGVRAVSVITRDGKEHLIPNENLMTQEVENWSYTDRNVRVRIAVTVAYGCNLELAQDLMLRAATESPRVLDTPQPNVWLTALGENGAAHEILVWISDPESGVGNVRSDVLNRLWKLFGEHGITVPAPRRDVRFSGGPEVGRR
ncbi:mechanosensitive ion channel family protein [Sphingomonas sp. TDK1]|uniref:mechanosensitive ion channel family protein n=1 Tax=Sphingomonas sp. TDK1 TaxID=453247 RepID=UPI0007D92740|nr:mechanosensitive ion channel domain-containing protein [Sphingomonas sp. TDK1]OAN66319.1 mechanosensitive ion channel protein MscS [Sphingomonas sp. TDK1]